MNESPTSILCASFRCMCAHYVIMHLLMNFWLDMAILSKALESDREGTSYWQVWHKQPGMFILEEGPTLYLYSFHLDFYLNPKLLLHTQWLKPLDSCKHQWPPGKLNFNNGVLNLNQYIYLVHTDESAKKKWNRTLP